MNSIVAVATGVDRFPHLLPSIAFLKPAIPVTTTRDQVVLGCAQLHRSQTKLTLICFRSAHWLV